MELSHVTYSRAAWCQEKQMIHTKDTFSWYELAKFLSERRCHLIGSAVQAGCCRAIVSCCRSQWNLTLDRAGACCQELNLIPSSCSHWRAIKKGLWPHGCARFISGQIFIFGSCVIRELLQVCAGNLFCFFWKLLCTYCHFTWQPCPDDPSCHPNRCPCHLPSSLASQTDACLAHWPQKGVHVTQRGR